MTSLELFAILVIAGALWWFFFISIWEIIIYHFQEHVHIYLKAVKSHLNSSW